MKKDKKMNGNKIEIEIMFNSKVPLPPSNLGSGIQDCVICVHNSAGATVIARKNAQSCIKPVLIN
ncbi:MAG: hypothetical protein HY606_14655 [Planctomycetes bacterium]|nr:hypothetical protein [Planctomycetota bacterium]